MTLGFNKELIYIIFISGQLSWLLSRYRSIIPYISCDSEPANETHYRNLTTKKKTWETIYIEIDSSLSIMPVIATNGI